MESDATTAGSQIVNGMIAGMNSRSGSLYGTVRGIVNYAIATANSAAGVASPSKKTKKTFEWVGEGMVVGLESKRKKVADTARSVVNDALRIDVSKKIEMPEINDRIPTIKPQNDSTAAVSNLTKKVEDSIENLTKKVEEIADGGFVFDGDTIVGKWVPKINRALGKTQMLKERGVT